MKMLSINQIALNGEVCMKTVMFNCDDIVSGSPRIGYLLRRVGCCGVAVDYQVTSDATKVDANSLEGVIVEDKNGNQWLFDAPDVAALQASCDACCGVGAVPIVDQYDNTMPAFTAPASSVFCITRSDDGGAAAVQKTTLDYMDKVDTIVHKSNAAGVSKYRVTAVSAPKAVGADVVAAGECA